MPQTIGGWNTFFKIIIYSGEFHSDQGFILQEHSNHITQLNIHTWRLQL